MKLQNALGNQRNGNIKIFMNDMNARVGLDHIDYVKIQTGSNE